MSMPSVFFKSVCGALLLLPTLLFAQARLVLNGARINITNGAQLVVDNPAADAITRYDGHIISEGETNTVKWNIGTTTGTYTVPLGYGTTDYLPLRFTKDAGTGNGSFSFDTYHTTWRNSDLLPANVTHVSMNGEDRSPFLVDRFWKINAGNYTVKPSLTDLTFTYSDAEGASPNVLTESNLEPRRWNSALQTWIDYNPAATVNTVANTVTLAAMAASQLQDWWMLADNVYVLAMQGLQLSAAAAGLSARLNWETVDEKAGAVFTLDRSADGIHFTFVANKQGAANNGATQQYTYLDTKALLGKSYYRVVQTDGDGTVHYSAVRGVFIEAGNRLFTVYPNPVTDHRCTINLHSNALKNVRLELISMPGAVVWTQTVPDGQQLIPLQLPGTFASGTYVLKITSAQGTFRQKIIVR